MTDTVGGCYRAAVDLAARYDSVASETVLGAFLSLMPRGPDRLVLDVGEGTGRDAAWLAAMAFDVVAAQPSKGMRREARLREPEPAIRRIDNANHLIEDVLFAEGAVNHTPVYPSEGVERGLAVNAVSLILIHNVPSGNPAPSDADIVMTPKFRDACAVVSLRLLDHISVGKGSESSFQALGAAMTDANRASVVAAVVMAWAPRCAQRTFRPKSRASRAWSTATPSTSAR